MKTIFSIITVLVLSVSAFAQQTLKIRVEKDVDGKKMVTEKVIDVTGMSDVEKEQVIEDAKGDLDLSKAGSNKIKVIIEEDEGQTHRECDVNENDIELRFERFGNEMESFGKEFPKRFNKITDDVIAWTDDRMMRVEDSAPIRTLTVYPNEPETNILNIKFFAPHQGDVSIVVTDVLGNKISTKSLPDFKGKYVGQIELDQETSGTYFVLVSQGEDGISKRITL